MINRRFGQTALFGAVVLFLVSTGAQEAWAGANKVNSPTKQELFITQAFVTFEDAACSGSDTVTITGSNFLNGDPPVIIFGEFGALTTLCFPATDTELVAELPSPLPDGDYRIEVITGAAVTMYDAYDLTVGAVGPAGPEGPAGPAGASYPASVVTGEATDPPGAFPPNSRATIRNITLNDETITGTCTPGGKVTLNFDWSFVQLGSAIQQVNVGFAGGDTRCIASGVAGQSGSSSLELTCPSTPGPHALGVRDTLCFGCPPSCNFGGPHNPPGDTTPGYSVSADGDSFVGVVTVK
jgi:hypothetical protein